MKNANTLVVANQAQKTILESEVFGQISDGAWENATPHDHWEVWCDTRVVVAEDGVRTGRMFHARKDNYDLVRKDLWDLDVVTDRTLEAVREATGDASYSRDDLMADLRELKTTFRTELPESVEARQHRADALAEREAARAEARAKARAVREQAATEARRVKEQHGTKGYISTYGREVTMSHATLLELLALIP